MGNTQKKLGITSRKNNNNNNNNNSTSSQKEKKSRVKRHDTTEQVEILLKQGPITEYYDVDYNTVLGRGHYATVNLGVDKKTGVQVAVKRIQISKSRVEALKREVEVLRKVGKHPNIVTLYDIFITETELILVLELLLGGELFDRMVEKGPYSERQASHHIRRIGQALKFLHRHGIVHRDLKPENLILAHKGDDSELKIADFGLAKIVDNVENSTMRTVCGTWAYCAPEVKTTMSEEGGAACYTAKVDLWSVGVILFVILGAYHPFDADGDATDAQLWSNICSGQFDFDDPAWHHISAGAKDLIRNLIVVDPDKRFGTDELLSHPWVKQNASVPATPITPNIDRSLIDYNGKRKSKKSFVSSVKQRIGGGGNNNNNHIPSNNYNAHTQSIMAQQQQQQQQQQQMILEQQKLQIEQQHIQQQIQQQKDKNEQYVLEHQQLHQYHQEQLNQLNLQFQRKAQQEPNADQQQLQFEYQQQLQQLQAQQEVQRQQLLQHQQASAGQSMPPPPPLPTISSSSSSTNTDDNNKTETNTHMEEGAMILEQHGNEEDEIMNIVEENNESDEDDSNVVEIPQLTLNTLLTQNNTSPNHGMEVETPSQA